MEHHDTRILKFFLNVSPEKQKERLMERVQIKEKHWKHKDGDWTTREKFSDYLQVYDRIFRECNEIPWHMVPSDTNWQKLYFVASEVLKTMRNLKLEWPDLKSELFNKDN